MVRKLKTNSGMNKILICSVLLFACIAGCKTTKTNKGTKPLKPKSLVKHVEENELKFEYLSARTKIEYTNAGKNTSFKGDLKMKKDSVIWLSITPLLGIEVARILINPDTVHIIDRINKIYYRKPLSYLATEYNAPLDFKSLQSMIAGGLVFFNSKNASSSVENNMYIVETENDILTNKVTIESAYFHFIRSELSEKNTNRKIIVSYGDYQIIGTQSFSHQREIEIIGENPLSLDLGFSKVKLDEPLQFSFTVSDKYEIVN